MRHTQGTGAAFPTRGKMEAYEAEEEGLPLDVPWGLQAMQMPTQKEQAALFAQLDFNGAFLLLLCCRRRLHPALPPPPLFVTPRTSHTQGTACSRWPRWTPR